MENRRPDRTAEMETFLAVACAGSFSGAARESGLTPSAVSRLVSRIEQRLGVQLVVRTTRSLRLTREGEDYALAARRMPDKLFWRLHPGPSERFAERWYLALLNHLPAVHSCLETPGQSH